MPQTSIASAPAAAYAGQLGDPGTDAYAVTGLAEDALTAGQPVLRGTDPARQAKAIPDGATVDETTLLGWALLDTTRPYDAADPIEAGDSVAVLRRGRVWVKTSAAVTAGNPVYVGNATAQLGDIADATGVGLTLCPGARFATSTSGAGLALVEVNL